MTAAGIALIAGGLATLIGFRHALWGGDQRQPREPRAIEAPRRAAALTAGTASAAPGSVRSAAPPAAALPAPRVPRRRRAPASATARDAETNRPMRASDESAGHEQQREKPTGHETKREEPAGHEALRKEPAGRGRPPLDESAGKRGQSPATTDAEPPDGGLASLGLAVDEPSGDIVAESAEAGTGPGGTGPVDALTRCAEGPARTEAAPQAPARSRVDRYGDRVDDWVRPQYRQPADLGVTGEYWTPAPESSYADQAYGWPVPVERLPPAPPYPEPAGAGIEPAEPTALVPQWPPAQPPDRADGPRDWTRNTPDHERVGRWDALDRNSEPAEDGRVVVRRRPASAGEDPPDVAESTQMLPMAGAEKPRTRPRPRPRPHHPDARSTVYVSKHAADPS